MSGLIHVSMFLILWVVVVGAAPVAHWIATRKRK